MKVYNSTDKSKSSKKHIIYALLNPVSGEIFYIGCTTKSLQIRLENHYRSLAEAMNTDRRKMSERHRYLKNIYPIRATIIKLDETNTNPYELEKEYIEKYKQLNPNLTNVAIGGKGGDTFTNLTNKEKEERQRLTKLALTGRKKPEGFAENLSITRTGSGNPRAGATKYGKVVRFNEKSDIITIYNAGYELAEEFGKYFHGNLIRSLKNLTTLEKLNYYHRTTNTYWNFEHNLKYNPVNRITHPFTNNKI